MPEIKEEVSIPISSEDIKCQVVAGPLTIMLTVEVSDNDAATIAWLINHGEGTRMSLEIGLK